MVEAFGPCQDRAFAFVEASTIAESALGKCRTCAPSDHSGKPVIDGFAYSLRYSLGRSPKLLRKHLPK
jgi:hypothetical protein